jgi:hypothetical protein
LPVNLTEMSPLLRRRSDQPEGGSDGPAGVATDGIAPRHPHAGLLRRERRALARVRDDQLRDLGGLLVEMYRRGGFRDDLLAERAAAIVGIDARLAEIHELLSLRGRMRRCDCGAPLLHGSRFCPNCGRDLSQRPAGPEVDATVVEPTPET